MNDYLSSTLCTNTGWPILLPTAAVVIAAIVLAHYLRRQCLPNNPHGKGRVLKLTAAFIFLVWAISWGLYMVAISGNATAQTGICEKLFRSATAAIGLFAFNIDSNILDSINRCTTIKDALSAMSVIAGGCTLCLLTVLICHRFKASIRLWFATNFQHRSTVYLFWSNSRQSRLLAESIRQKHEQQHNDDYWILIADPALADEDDAHYGVRENLIRTFTHRSVSLDEAAKKNTLLSVASVDIAKLAHPAACPEDIFEKANLGSVKKLIAAAKVHMFFLSEDEDYNISALRNISGDKTVATIKRNIVFHCCARRNDLYGTIEDLAIKKDLEVRIADPSNLSVEMLKRDVANHPVTLMDIAPENPATVSSAFNALVVGFDATGRDALRFVYEFGAFVDRTSTPEDVRRSPFHCKVVDHKLSLQATAFKTGAPAAVAAVNPDGTPLIDFTQCDYNHEQFYSEVLAPMVEQLNMVFITVGSDEQGIALAVKIFKYIRRYRKEMRRLRIYVRCYSSDKEGLTRQIAAHYNEGSGMPEPIIIPFGSEEDIFTYELIVDERFREAGKTYQQNYATLRGENEFWDMRRDLATGKKSKDKHSGLLTDDIPASERSISLDALASLRRKEQQDVANALHAGTKLHLLESAVPADFDWEDFIGRYFDADGKPRRTSRKNQKKVGSEIQYPTLTGWEYRIIRTLAMLEHLRWNASHELLGYVRAPEGLHACNEQTQQHNCLRSWQELDAESDATTEAEGWDADYISFDFSVVDTTLSMKYRRK